MSDPKLRRGILAARRNYFDRAEIGIESTYLGTANVSVGPVADNKAPYKARISSGNVSNVCKVYFTGGVTDDEINIGLDGFEPRGRQTIRFA
jgi:hypothetical protein